MTWSTCWRVSTWAQKNVYALSGHLTSQCILICMVHATCSTCCPMTRQYISTKEYLCTDRARVRLLRFLAGQFLPCWKLFLHPLRTLLHAGWPAATPQADPPHRRAAGTSMAVDLRRARHHWWTSRTQSQLPGQPVTERHGVLVVSTA